jgi:hypothetical protein
MYFSLKTIDANSYTCTYNNKEPALYHFPTFYENKYCGTIIVCKGPMFQDFFGSSIPTNHMPQKRLYFINTIPTALSTLNSQQTSNLNILVTK